MGGQLERRPLVYPQDLDVLYTAETKIYRRKMQERVEAIYDARMQYVDEEEQRIIRALRTIDNLLIPDSSVLAQLQHPMDIIAVTGFLNGKCFMFLGVDSSESPLYEGVGKSHLAYTLLGIVPDYSMIPLDMNELRMMDPMRFHVSTPGALIASSNATFIGLNGGRLSFGLSLGEEAIASWDMAREIYRMMGSPHGERFEDKSQDFKLEIGNHCCIDKDAFAKKDKVNSPERVFVVKRRRLTGRKKIRVNFIEKRNTRAELRKILFGNPIYNKSPYWGINEAVHNEYTEMLLGGLETFPEIILLDIQEGEGQVPIDRAAEVIKEIMR